MVTEYTVGSTRILVSPLLEGDWSSRRERERASTAALLREAFGPEAHIELTHAPSGAPRLRVNGERWHLSVTHSRTRAAIAIDAARPIGLDAEEWREQLRRVESKYLRPDELAYWAASPERRLQAWMAKEAAFKAFEPEGVTLISIKLDAGAAYLGGSCAELEIGEGWALARLIP